MSNRSPLHRHLATQWSPHWRHPWAHPAPPAAAMGSLCSPVAPDPPDPWGDGPRQTPRSWTWPRAQKCRWRPRVFCFVANGGDEDGWSLGYRDEVGQQSPCLSEVWFWWLVLGSKQLNMLNCGLWFQNIEPNVAHLEWSSAAKNPRLVSQPFGKKQTLRHLFWSVYNATSILLNWDNNLIDSNNKKTLIAAHQKL